MNTLLDLTMLERQIENALQTESRSTYQRFIEIVKEEIALRRAGDKNHSDLGRLEHLLSRLENPPQKNDGYWL